VRLWHGGVPDLRPGDLITPGHDRRVHQGCSYCAARANEAGGGDRPVIDPLARHKDVVYLTTSRGYARYHASLWGYGDLYRVAPVGTQQRSTEDTIETYTAEHARVLAVVDRAVLLTWSQRRAIRREWTEADARAGLA
jgi:hypothetical protein